MKFDQMVKHALRRIYRYKLKTFFMMLGIVISVNAVILSKTIGDNVRVEFEDFIRTIYPSDTITLNAGNGFMGGGLGSTNLKVADVEAIVNSINGIVDWDPAIYIGGKSVSSGSEKAYVAIVGGSESSSEVRNRPIVEGENFTKDDIARQNRVALIGSTAAKALFPNESPVGKTIFYNNVTLTIKGVLKQVGVDPHGNDRDNELHLPYTLLMKKILKRDYLSAASFSLDESTPGNVERFMEDVRVLLRNRHGISDAADNDFTVISPTMMMGMVADVYKTFDLLVPVISLIAFFISAVVILNITLITVRERKAEIGLRKALGARVRDIKNLIIIEIVMVSVISCFIALLISKLFIMAVSPYLADYYGITAMNTSWDAVLIAILVAIVTGLVSALIPADKAAKMHPVTALS